VRNRIDLTDVENEAELSYFKTYRTPQKTLKPINILPGSTFAFPPSHRQILVYFLIW